MFISADRFFIVAGIVSLALLALMVGIIAALRARVKTSSAEPPADSTPPSDWMKSLAGAAGKTLAGSAHTDSVGANLPADAIVVLRDPASNDWVVEVNGMRYQNLKDLHDDKAAAKVLAAIGGLQRFAGAIPIMTPPPDVEKPSASGAIPIVPLGESIPFVSPDSTPKLEPVIVAALTQTSSSTKSKYPPPADSILAQIEKVLQRNLMKDPVLAQKYVHIGAAADGSLLIEVDWDTYKSVDDVPDDHVRDVIKASIREWELTP
jgi:hypothetical protein